MIDVQEICLDFDFLYGQNADWRSYHEDIADFCLPRKAWINTIKTKGERLKLNFLYDTTAIHSLQVMSSGFHSNLTNPASDWFSLQTRDPRFMRDREVQFWFKNVTEKMMSIIGASNFDTTMQEFYSNFGSFGTSSILIEDDDEDKVRYTEIPVEQINLVEDSKGRIVKMYRKFMLTAYQAFRLWGEDAGKNVLDKYDGTGKNGQKPFEDFEFLHYVGPRKNRDRSKSEDFGPNMRFESGWIEIKGKHLIKEGGFKEFPYVVGRFYRDSNDVMGYSPAMNALPAIKLVNAQQMTVMRAGQNATEPALLIPDKGFTLPLNRNPNYPNYYNKAEGSADDIRAFPGSDNIPIGIDLIKMSQEDIEKSFFVPLFRAISEQDKKMTAQEVQIRRSEGLALLGPVVGRVTSEVLSPLILRTFSILADMGEFDPPPEIIMGQDMDVIYLSPLAKAQRTQELNSIGSVLTAAGQMAQLKPEVMDLVDVDAALREIAEIQGVNPELLKEAEVVKQIRQKREQFQQQQAQVEAMHKAAAIAKTGAEAAHKGAMAGAVK